MQMAPRPQSPQFQHKCLQPKPDLAYIRGRELFFTAEIWIAKHRIHKVVADEMTDLAGS